MPEARQASVSATSRPQERQDLGRNGLASEDMKERAQLADAAVLLEPAAPLPWAEPRARSRLPPPRCKRGGCAWLDLPLPPHAVIPRVVSHASLKRAGHSSARTMRERRKSSLSGAFWATRSLSAPNGRAGARRRRREDQPRASLSVRGALPAGKSAGPASPSSRSSSWRRARDTRLFIVPTAQAAISAASS